MAKGDIKFLHRLIDYKGSTYHTMLKLPTKNYHRVPRDEDGYISREYAMNNLQIQILENEGRFIPIDFNSGIS